MPAPCHPGAARAVGTALTLIAECRPSDGPNLSPTLRGVRNSAVVCCDGTWVAPSASYVQAAGAWKESEMALQEARCDRCRAEPQQWRRAGYRRKAQGRAMGSDPQGLTPAEGRSSQRDTNRRS